MLQRTDIAPKDETAYARIARAASGRDKVARVDVHKVEQIADKDKVDKVDILKSLKAGDEIEATVYDNDYTLYDIKNAGAPAAGQRRHPRVSVARGPH